MNEISVSGHYKRLKWNEYFSYIALLVSQRSNCQRRHVGAVITDGNQILSTGYNGAPSGLEESCLDSGCEIVNNHCIRCLHAEQNAILQFSKNNNVNNNDNLEIYITDFPCPICAKMIVGLGIKKIHFVRPYQTKEDNEEFQYVMKLFRKTGIAIVQENIEDLLITGENNVVED